jgi:hypothetical protein
MDDKGVRSALDSFGLGRIHEPRVLINIIVKFRLPKKAGFCEHGIKYRVLLINSLFNDVDGNSGCRAANYLMISNNELKEC